MKCCEGGKMNFPGSFTSVTPKMGAKIACGSAYHGFQSWNNPDGSRKVEPMSKEGSYVNSFLGNPKGGKR